MKGFLLLKPKFSSIKFKFAFLAILVSLIGYGISIYFSTRWMGEEIQTDYHEKAALMWTHIIHDLENAMLRINHEEIFDTLAIYKNYKEVKEVRIFNSKGEEAFSQKKGQPEPRVHEVLSRGESIRYEEQSQHQKLSTFIVPIKNKPICHRCHGADEPMRGALLLSLDQKGMEEYIGKETRKFILLFGLLTLSMAIIAMATVHHLLLRPLESIRKGAEAIARGDFHYRVPIPSKDEIGTLAVHFNHMAQTLAMLFKSLEDQQQEIKKQYDLISLSRRQWQDTFDCITDPIVVMDRNCTIHQANRAFQRMFQKEIHSLNLCLERRQTCQQLFGSCFLSKCPHKRVTVENIPLIQEVEYPHLGTIFEVSVFPYHRAEEEFEGSVVILKDVTEKKKREEQAILRERLSAIGQIVSSVVHEINNPLATVGVSTEGLLKRVRENRFDPSLFENYLRIIQEEIRRSQRITDRMLSFVRNTDKNREEIDIHEFLNKTIEALNFQGRMNGVEVLRDYDQEAGKIRCNDGELRQVFFALLNNAIEAIGERGKITLETMKMGDRVAIKVTDTGPGIPHAHLERIFTPFFTTKSERGGTGLGLFIAKKMVEENGGSIEVSSVEGSGTTFTITLPT